jgi:hypothetical protein
MNEQIVEGSTSSDRVKELSKYKLDLAAVQKVSLDSRGIAPAREHILFYRKVTENHELSTDFFVHKRITLSVNKVESVGASVLRREQKVNDNRG